MFKLLEKDDKAVNSVNISGDVATLQHTSVHPVHAHADTDRRIQLTWAFDYTDVSRKELIDIASRHLVIQMRTKFKSEDGKKGKDGNYRLLAKPEDWNDRTFSVREYLDQERRQPKDPVAEAKKRLDALTDEQKADILGIDVETLRQMTGSNVEE